MIPLGAIPAHHAMRLGARTAVTQDDIGLDWPSLEAAANRFVNAMTVRGVGRDHMVTVVLPNGNAFFAVVFGLWKIGATPNPVSSKTPVSELRAVLQVVRPKLVICSDAALAAALDGVTLDFAEGASSAPVKVEVARHWKAMPSGGSTGTPKVIVDHRPAAFDPDEPAMGIPNDGVLLNPGPLYHNAPFSISTAGLVRGSRVVSMRRFDAEEALRLIDRHRVQFVNFVPTMMHRIWRLPEEFRSAYDLSSLERVWHMAAPMPPWLKRAWIDWLGADHVWELYGGTENTGSTVISGSEWLQRPGSVGRPTAGARIRAQDEAGVPLPAGRVGELYFMPASGARSTYHYLGATSREDVAGWDSIGDYGWVDEDGYVFLADRRTDLIISGGANIYPAEVEAAILEHPRVAGAVVIGLPDEDLGARPHAILRLTPGVGPDDIIADLLSWLETRLARYKIPRTFEATDEELRDDAGKVRRSALRAARL
jgi:bile acid-coenzyme A ligase